MSKTGRHTKRKLGCLGLGLLLGGYLFFFQLPYLADPGLRDLPIREKLAELSPEDCAEICAECESLYSAVVSELEGNEYIQIRDASIPATVRAVGYRNGVMTEARIEFRAGAGGFSQVGPILLICHFDPATAMATRLRVDRGSYDPATGELER